MSESVRKVTFGPTRQVRGEERAKRTESDLDDLITETKSYLASLVADKAERTKMRVESVQPVYEFTLTLVTDSWYQPMDESCLIYDLVGKVVNKSELEAVGQSTALLFEGGMKYVFNTLSGKFVISIGGGSIFLKDSNAWDEIAKFVQQSPCTATSFDVTSIVERYRGKS